MNKGLIASQSVIVNASSAEVWNALTDPALIKQYLFGTETVTDWKVGSPIIYKGMWEGKPYEDRGTVINIIPEQLIEMSYWSIAFGPDVPENRKTVTYKVEPEGDSTKVTVTQDGNATEDSKNHSEQNWKMVLDGLKKLLEK